MAIRHLKQAAKTPESETATARKVAAEMLAEIERRRRSRRAGVRREAGRVARRDRRDARGDRAPHARHSRTAPSATSSSPPRRCAGSRSRSATSIREFAVEIHPGARSPASGSIPVNVAGCYVPTGRYAHIASAYMSVATAKAAGVPTVIACSTPYRGEGTTASIRRCSTRCRSPAPTSIMTLGGVQAIAALAYGLFTGKPADIIVGPGQQVRRRGEADAVRRRSASTSSPGPRRSRSSPTTPPTRAIVASDLVGQAEHGHESPAWLFTTSRSARRARDARACRRSSPRCRRPRATRQARAWRDYGEVVLCGTREEVARDFRPLRVGASRGARARPRLVARPAYLLRLALPRRGDDGRVRRQDVRAESHPADEGRGALFRRPVGAQVHQDGDVAADDARREPRRWRRSPRASRASKGWRRTPAPRTTGWPSTSRGEPSSAATPVEQLKMRRAGPRSLSSRRGKRRPRHRRQLRHRADDRAWRYAGRRRRGDPRRAARAGARGGRGRDRGGRRARGARSPATSPIGRRSSRAPRRRGKPFGAPDIVVNAAGINIRKPMQEVSESGLGRRAAASISTRRSSCRRSSRPR